MAFEVSFYRISINSHDVIRSYYAGLSRFEELNSEKKVLREREKCYQGSQLHFFRNLVNNIWGESSFILFKDKFSVNANDYFTIKDTLESKKVTVAKQKEMHSNSKFVARFSLLFNKKKESQIIFETDTFYVDQFGNNSNIENVIFSGYISEQKVGDMLPMNYGIN